MTRATRLHPGAEDTEPEQGRGSRPSPLDDMLRTATEARRQLRDEEVASGRRAPRTQREMAIFSAAVKRIAERGAARAAGVPEADLPPLLGHLPPGRLLPKG